MHFAPRFANESIVWAVNDRKHKLHGMSSTTGTMTERADALARKDGALTTK